MLVWQIFNNDTTHYLKMFYLNSSFLSFTQVDIQLSYIEIEGMIYVAQRWVINLFLISSSKVLTFTINLNQYGIMLMVFLQFFGPCLSYFINAQIHFLNKTWRDIVKSIKMIYFQLYISNISAFVRTISKSCLVYKILLLEKQ